MAAPLPALNNVANLIGMLVGNRPRVAKGTPAPPTKNHSVATYVDASKKIIYAAVADVAFVASAGAALAMIPAGVVGECVKSGKATETMVENAYEVLNVGASLFNEIEGTALHVKIEKLSTMPQLPPELTTRLAKPTARLDLVVSIPGYPDGKISFLALS